MLFRSALAFFDDLVPPGLGITVRPMFGQKAAFVDGHMFLGVFHDRVLVRLGPADHATLMAEEGTEVFDPTGGRPMREYVLLPAGWADDPNTAQEWVVKALGFARALPPKKKPAAKKAGAGKTKAAPSAKKAPPRKKAAAKKPPVKKARR